VPSEPLLELDRLPIGRLCQSQRLNFVHFLSRLDPGHAGDVRRLQYQLLDLYRQMIAAAGWSQLSEQTPYNLLVTREWILLVPRRAECYRQISLNALAFAGSLFVKDRAQLEQLLATDPLSLLGEAALEAP
jgi:ATP adenylyltransferase